MAEVVKIWKGDLMMRSKSLAKNKDLQRKVLCSLLAAGVMSICISGGDVWAADHKDIYAQSGNDIEIVEVGAVNINSTHAQSVEGAGRYAAVVADAADVTVQSDRIHITNQAAAGNERAYGIAIVNSGNATFIGNTIVDVSGSGTQDLRALRNNGGAKLTFSDGNVEVKVNGSAGSGYIAGISNWDGGEIIFNGNANIEAHAEESTDSRWVNAVQVAGGVTTFNGASTKLFAYNDNYTAQTMVVMGNGEYTGGTVNFNSDKTELKAVSKFGVNGIGFNAGVSYVNFNKGDVEIHTIIEDGVGVTNAIGILGGDNVTVSKDVGNFDVIVEGAGVDKGNMNYSNGTAGIYESAGKTAIDSENLNITVTAGQDTNNSKFDETQVTEHYSNTYGIRTDCGGIVSVGQATNTVINTTDGYKNAIGVYAGKFVQYPEDGAGTVSILGNTTITATGTTASNALLAEDGGEITVGSAGKTVALTGDVVAEGTDSTITLAGDTNTVAGTVTADGGNVVLGGSDKATYNADKFVTTNSGKITVSGGTLNINDLSDSNKFDLADNSLEVTGKGVLKAASDKVFETDTSGKKIIAGVDSKVLFSGGKLAISDATYTLADSKNYSDALKTADSTAAKTTIVMTGNLQDGSVGNEAAVEDLGTTGAVHTNVTGTVGSGTLTLGDSSFGSGTVVGNDLGVKDLDFTSDSSTGEASVNISNDTSLTLVGDGTGELLKGTNNSNNSVTVGGSSTAGTLTLGSVGAAASGGNLNANVTVGHADAALNVEAGSFTVTSIKAEQGTVKVDSGAALTTENLTVGSSNSGTEGTVAAAGSLDVDTLAIEKGSVAVSGSLNAGKLTVSDSSATISVGDSGSAGTLTAQNVSLGGASIVLDPVWDAGGTDITAASKGALNFASAVDGKLTVGQNSVLSLGTTDTAKAEAVFANSGLNWGEKDITAALYIHTAQTLDASNGGLKVDGSLTHESSNKVAAANTAYFADQSLLMVDSSLLSGEGALKTTDGTLTVDAGAKLYIANAEAGKNYVVVSGFGNSNSAVNGWGINAADNLLLNKLVKVDAANTKFENGTYTVTTTKVNASEALPGVALPNILDAMAQDTDSANAGIKYLSNAISDLNSDAQAIAAVNGFAQGAENSGATHIGTMAAFTIGDTIQSRMSLASDVAAPQGGKGKGTDAADNGSIWAQYIHNKDKVDNMGGVSYDGQYNGVIIGGDFAPTGKYHSGVAFSYGDGSSTGSVSKNDFDFWGLSYYGSIKNDDTNVIFDAGYSKTSNDIKGAVDIDSDTKVLTLGVKGEKLINNGHGTSYVPYAGLRYLNVDGGSYNGTIGGAVAANYSTDKANIWMLPIGIGVHNETVTTDGWKLRPMADIAYVWTFGDNNSAMDVTVPGVNATDRLGYDIMDSGFFVGKLGLEAEKGDWTYGLGYACQKGSHAQNSKFMLNVTYSF